MNLKKALTLLLAVVLTFSLFACAPADDGEGVKVRVAALSGATGLGMAKLMEDAAQGTAKNDYSFDVYDAPEVLLPEITSDKYDIAALPTNVAAKLYNNTKGKIQILALNTLGVLYMLEIGTSNVKSIADLRGKTIYTTGQGSTPEYMLKYVLEKNGLTVGTDVQIVFETTADGVVTHAAEGAVLMLPEPKVTAVKGQLGNVTVALNMTDEWNKVCSTPLAQGCVVVNKEFAAKNPEAVAAFLEEYEASITYVRENAAAASLLVEKFKIIPKAALAEKAIPNSNLTFLAGKDMKAALVPLYQVLFNAQASSVGGALPADDFYYGAN
ncbi:MAG: ABC transporter substrate-binding protein [Clostridia bacterium]|nr:ABC transporter substrate-binding protein [Clostridia bacterium]